MDDNDWLELKSDFSLIPAEEHKHPAFPWFEHEMSGRCYGDEELNDAWHFFRVGWDAACSL